MIEKYYYVYRDYNARTLVRDYNARTLVRDYNARTLVRDYNARTLVRDYNARTLVRDYNARTLVKDYNARTLVLLPDISSDSSASTHKHKSTPCGRTNTNLLIFNNSLSIGPFEF